MDVSLLNNFKDKKVFLTGATGFIGCRLAEILIKEYGAKVYTLVRDYGKAVRLARLPVHIYKGDITIKQDIENAMQECDYVFHCAYGNKGSKEARDEVNILGTRNLLEVALSTKIKSFVFLSTQSVYKVSNDLWLDEKAMKDPTGNSYGESKLQAEREVLTYQQKGLNVVVIQPTAVYGPWSPSYGIRIFDHLNKARIPLIDGGNGICNAVYVDDLIQAMLKAAVTTSAYGKDYLINGLEHITWKEFYSYFEQIGNITATTVISKEEALAHYKKSTRRKSFLSVLLRIVKLDVTVLKELLTFKAIATCFLWVRKIIPASFYQKIVIKLKQEKNTASNHLIEKTKPLLVVSPEDIRFFSAQTKVSSRKATVDFGYQPIYSFKTGFSNVSSWYKWFNDK